MRRERESGFLMICSGRSEAKRWEKSFLNYTLDWRKTNCNNNTVKPDINDHLSITATILMSQCLPFIKTNNMWPTTTFQQKPLFLGHGPFYTGLTVSTFIFSLFFFPFSLLFLLFFCLSLLLHSLFFVKTFLFPFTLVLLYLLLTFLSLSFSFSSFLLFTLSLSLFHLFRFKI